MHEKILQGVTVGVVAGLAVYWLTNSRRRYGCQSVRTNQYSPLTGDIRKINRGTGTCACCQCCGLVAPENTTAPLAADYLCNKHGYGPAVSNWNLGVSLNIKDGLDAKVYVDRMQATEAYGATGPDTVPSGTGIESPLKCDSCVTGQVCCTEVI